MPKKYWGPARAGAKLRSPGRGPYDDDAAISGAQAAMRAITVEAGGGPTQDRHPEPSGVAAAARLAGFAADLEPGSLPGSVLHEAKRSVVNMIAAALGGCRDDAIERMMKVGRELAGPPQATVIGRPETLDLASAACINAASANVLDFDDAHLKTVIHPAAPVASAALAIAERRHLSGRALLEAVALGIEVTCRLGNALGPGHYSRGFHITATCGVVGAAVAAGRLLGLTAERLAHAIGIAATRAGGLVENLGFMAKSVGVGDAGRDGLLAALYAEAGIDAAATALEGPRGFLSVLGDNVALAELVDDLGGRWEALANTYKPYPAGIVLSPVIDAILALRSEPGFDPADVEALTVVGNPLLLARADRPNVTTGREAKISLQHSVAVALLRGRAGVTEFLDGAVSDPLVKALRARVAAVADPATPIEAATVRLTLSTGSTREITIREARGSLARPLTDDELSAKLTDLAFFGTPAVNAPALLDALWSLDRISDVQPLLRLTVPRRP
jgi:2-methylcitrate dehydratase PrpD